MSQPAIGLVGLNLAGKWLVIESEPFRRGARTSTHRVSSRESGVLLGRVIWHAPWRRYVFVPAADTIFEEQCLGDIATFVRIMTEEHRATWKSRGGAHADPA